MMRSVSRAEWDTLLFFYGVILCVGGLSIGSAAGVALMGTARGVYTFGAHLKWLPAIALGYFASILCHLWINARHF
jgi:Na+/H+ antiporter NhaD/arsenite permease-like protein